jgi:hypothetical protein
MNLELHERSPALSELVLDDAAMARALGYRRPGKPDAAAEANFPKAREMPAHMIGLVEQMLAKGRELLEPRWLWTVMPATADKEQGTLLCHGREQVSLAAGLLVCGQLRAAQEVAVFVVTIGPRLETEARKMMHAGLTLEGFVLDSVGSVAVEAAADVLEKEVAQLAATRGCTISNRFSPGYCTWPTAGQQALFSLLPDQPAGVTLNDSSLMSPIKSISGVLGLGPALEHRPYPCDFCALETCHQRLVDARR